MTKSANNGFAEAMFKVMTTVFILRPGRLFWTYLHEALGHPGYGCEHYVVEFIK